MPEDTKYYYWDGRIIFVKQLQAGDYGVFLKNAAGNIEKLAHKSFPITRTKQASQENLDRYATDKCLSLVLNQEVI